MATENPQTAPIVHMMFPDEGMNVQIKDALRRLWNIFRSIDSFFGYKGFDGIEPLNPDLSPPSGRDRPPILSLEGGESQAGRAMQQATDRLLRDLATITLTYHEVRDRVIEARDIVDRGKGNIDSSYNQFFRFMEGQVILRKMSFFNPMIYGVSASDGAVLSTISSTAQELENSFRSLTTRLGELADKIDSITVGRVRPSKNVAAKRKLFRELFATTDGTPTGPVAAGLDGIVRASVRHGHNIFFGDVHEDNRIPDVIGKLLPEIAKEAGERKRVFAVEFVTPN